MKGKTRSSISVVNGAKVEHHTMEEELKDLLSFATAKTTRCKVCLLPAPVLQAMETVKKQGLLGTGRLTEWLRARHKVSITPSQVKYHFTHMRQEA